MTRKPFARLLLPDGALLPSGAAVPDDSAAPMPDDAADLYRDAAGWYIRHGGAVDGPYADYFAACKAASDALIAARQRRAARPPTLPEIRALTPARRWPHLHALMVAGDLTSAQARAELLAAWVAGGTDRDAREQIVALFRHAGFVTDAPGIAPPSAPVTLFRGQRDAAPIGLSWSASAAVARSFVDTVARTLANGGPVTAGGGGVVLEHTFPPGAILGRFLRGAQDEYVVVPPHPGAVARHDPATIPDPPDFWQRMWREATRQQEERAAGRSGADRAGTPIEKAAPDSE